MLTVPNQKNRYCLPAARQFFLMEFLYFRTGEVTLHPFFQRITGNCKVAVIDALPARILPHTQINICRSTICRNIDHHSQTAPKGHAGMINGGEFLEHILAFFQGQLLHLEQLDAGLDIQRFLHFFRWLHQRITLQFRQIFFVHQMVCQRQLICKFFHRLPLGEILIRHL